MGVYNRTADATVKLQTGGKAKSRRQNLFCISATAAEVTDKFSYSSAWEDSYGEWYFDGPEGTVPIPGQSITIDGKPVGADGKQWRAYADNDTRDVTPRIKNKDFYTFNVTQQKYKLEIQVNGARLYPTKVINGATFCVGQKLTFSPFWLPNDPPYVNDFAHWHLPGYFVNNHIPPPAYVANGSGYYTNDANYLAGENTSCWYVDGLQAGTAGMWMNLQFPNGQTVSIPALGQFNIDRPGFTNFNVNQLRFYDDFFPTWKGIYPKLEAEIDLCEDLNSKYGGSYCFTQLMSSTNGCYYTGGINYVDGTEIYGENASHVAKAYDPTELKTHTFYFGDNPDATAATCATMQVTYTDYFRFKPNGDDSIYITISTNTWTLDGSACLPSTVYRSNTSYTPAAPSDAFPYWEKSWP